MNEYLIDNSFQSKRFIPWVLITAS